MKAKRFPLGAPKLEIHQTISGNTTSSEEQRRTLTLTAEPYVTALKALRGLRYSTNSCLNALVSEAQTLLGFAEQTHMLGYSTGTAPPRGSGTATFFFEVQAPLKVFGFQPQAFA